MPDDRAHLGASGIVRALGPAAYASTWQAMQAFTASRGETTADEIWLTEHEPVYTLGLAGREEHVRVGGGIPLLRVDRGGQVTYHGPGQLVAYVLVDLSRRGLGVRRLVRALESAVVEWLRGVGVMARGDIAAPGVYVDDAQGARKIAAVGLRVRNGRTYHGLSVNVAMDLAPFAEIDPCGYPGLRVTQVADLVPRPPTLSEAGEALAPILWRRIAEASR